MTFLPVAYPGEGLSQMTWESWATYETSPSFSLFICEVQLIMPDAQVCSEGGMKKGAECLDPKE